MAGPFPGMDPYLEDSFQWRGVHALLISGMTEALNAKLPPEYAAKIDERLYILQPSESIYPDVG